jgi:hypothetical protein
MDANRGIAVSADILNPIEGGIKPVPALRKESKPRRSAPKSEPVAAPKAKAPADVPAKDWNPLFFLDHSSDTIYGAIVNRLTGEFKPGFAPAPRSASSLRQLVAICGGTGAPELGSVRAGEFRFEPNNTDAVYFRADGVIQVNTWAEPSIRKIAVPTTECPAGIRALLLHVMGDDVVSFERFLNWVAHIYQTGQRADTAWVWSGEQLTGKGLVMNEIMKPLFGYVVTQLASAFKDQFNSQLENCTILNVDECEFSRRDKSDIEQKMKTIITGTTLSIRGMHRAAHEVPNYISVILTSNSCVVANLPRGDRRYNVAPPQLQKLTVKYPNTDKIVARVRKELPAFAGFLKQYTVDTQKVRTAMVSEAKDDMTSAGSSGPEEFAHALKTGDLAHFLETYHTIAPRPAEQWGQRDRAVFHRALLDWLDSIDQEIGVRVATLCSIYNAIFEPKPPMVVDNFGKFMVRQGVKSVIHKMGIKGRIYVVRWESNKELDVQEERAALLKAGSGNFQAEETT